MRSRVAMLNNSDDSLSIRLTNHISIAFIPSPRWGKMRHLPNDRGFHLEKIFCLYAREAYFGRGGISIRIYILVQDPSFYVLDPFPSYAFIPPERKWNKGPV